MTPTPAAPTARDDPAYRAAYDAARAAIRRARRSPHVVAVRDLARSAAYDAVRDPGRRLAVATAASHAAIVDAIAAGEEEGGRDARLPI